MTPEDIAMFSMMGYDMTEPWKVANQGLKQESGAFYVTPGGERVYVPKIGEGMRMDADGNVSNAPGYTYALGEQRSAEEKAKAQYDYVDVMDAQGNQYKVPRSSLGGGNGGGNAVGALSGRNSAQVAYETEAAKKAAADAAAYLSTLREAVAKDQGVMKQLERFGELNRQTATGFGINNPMWGELWDSNKQQMKAITANLAPRQRPVGAGTTSDADLRLYLSALPGLDKYGDANRGIREEFARNLKEQQDKLKYAEQYVQRRGSLSGLESAWTARQEVSGKLKTNATYAKAADAWEAKYGSLDAPNPTTGKDFYSSLYERINK